MKYILKCFGILVVGIILEVLCLTGAFLLPVNVGTEMESLKIMEMEGWYPRATILTQSLDTHFHSNYPDVLDDNTDSIMLHKALDRVERTPLYHAMDMDGYSRYWHGYVSVLRPLLILFDYGELRILNGAGQLMLLFTLAMIVYRKRGWRYTVMLLSSYFLLMPIAMPLALQYTWVYYIAMCGCVVLLQKQRYFEKDFRYLYFFIVVGMLTSYLDLLTYPLFTWAFPLIWWLIFQEENKTAGKQLTYVVTSGFGWIAGYGINWCMKWVIGTWVLGYNVMESASHEAEVWRELDPGIGGILKSLYLNWKHYEYEIYLLILVLWLLWWCWKSFCGTLRVTNIIYSYALIACSSVVWYIVTVGQTLAHHFFTHRIWNVSILAFMAIVLDSISNDQSRDKVIISKKFIVLFVWIIAGLLAIPMTLTAREESYFTNGYLPYEEVVLEQNSSLDVIFTPRFPTIKELTLCMKSYGDEGEVCVAIREGNKVLYEERIPVSEYTEKTSYVTDVNWHFEKDRTYSFQISAINCKEKIAVLISKPGMTPLIEYSDVMMNGKVMQGQPLAGFRFESLPQSKRTLLFLFCSWIAVFVMMELVVYKGIQEIKYKKNRKGKGTV